ncbi:MAG: valine--tRNA ligase [Chloroflexi bacterium]|nr:valine--tRNA ligase [Chloroflexota bacterium]
MTEARSKNADMPKAYEPELVEKRLYEFWLERRYFTPSVDTSKKSFVIIMPPPNVTGELHLGHALTATLEDIMIRWHRMRGDHALWLPGTDHAGIATQVVVEQMLSREGVTRHDLGRERFVERVWEWVRKYGRVIAEQHKRLGASCDWSRERFTLDEGPSLAVRTTFVNLYKKRLIYRGERIINWCPRCSTALSDLEVEHKEQNDHLYYIRYKMADTDGFITVATTRPETYLGDTAVAVNPSDPRFSHLHETKVILPFIERVIPVITDAAVDPTFGTGAVKVTPAHDPVDFEIAQRSSLPSIKVINPDGKMNENAGPYAGMERFTCRESIIMDLRREGFLEKVEPYVHSVGHCQRCKTILEPMVSKQWFVQMKDLAAPAIEAVKNGSIKIIPERYTKVYLNWMENIRDWCISRQLWWGHRIPVWYCRDCNEITTAMKDPESCEHCDSKNIYQDPDVLDTWFSSALWPHSTLGWPKKTEDFRYFYPTTVMETGYDILFFWVARMIIMGLENTGHIPFSTVYLHGLIRDERGEKMSKVRGNVLNPLDAIAQYGTDALRFAITTGTSPGNDTRLSPSKLEAGRNFANKLWNAARFVISSVEGKPISNWRSPSGDGHIEDGWILSRLNRVTARVNHLIEEFEFGEAERELHDFLWGEFCDWYIEMAKLRLKMPEKQYPSPIPVLVHTLEKVLRLLHPFMPFITEELWQNLTRRLPEREGLPDSIMIAPYPVAEEKALDSKAEMEIEAVIDAIRAIRNARAELRIAPAQLLGATLNAGAFKPVFEKEAPAIHTLARVKPLLILGEGEETPSPQGALTLVQARAVIVLPLAGIVDLNAERKRLDEEKAECQKNIAGLEARLADHQFLSKAPAEVVERERQKSKMLQERLSKLEERLSQLPKNP